MQNCHTYDVPGRYDEALLKKSELTIKENERKRTIDFQTIQTAFILHY